MSKAGFGAAFSTLGQGLMQYGVRSMELDWQREREENLQRLRERQLTLAESEAAATADYREGQLGISRGQLTLAEQEAGNMAAYREGQLGISGQQLALQRDANESLDVHRAGTREAQMRSTDVDAARSGLSFDENDQLKVNPEFDAIRRGSEQRSDTMQQMGVVASSYRAKRAEKDPEFVGLSDADINLMALEKVKANPAKPLTVTDQANTIGKMVSSLEEELRQVMFLPADQQQAARAKAMGEIRTYREYLRNLLQGSGPISAAGNEPSPRRFGAGSDVLDLIANDLGLGG